MEKTDGQSIGKDAHCARTFSGKKSVERTLDGRGLPQGDQARKMEKKAVNRKLTSIPWIRVGRGGIFHRCAQTGNSESNQGYKTHYTGQVVSPRTKRYTRKDLHRGALPRGENKIEGRAIFFL